MCCWWGAERGRDSVPVMLFAGFTGAAATWTWWRPCARRPAAVASLVRLMSSSLTEGDAEAIARLKEIRHLSRFPLRPDDLERFEKSEAVRRVLSLHNASLAEKARVEAQQLAAPFRKTLHDTGSPEVQIAQWTARIKHLTDHLKKNRKDKSTQRGLLKMVARRRNLLGYLKNCDLQRYLNCIRELGLRK